ncbi:MAG: hypothetical protein WAT74_05020 [Flavobacteriales bacterium]
MQRWLLHAQPRIMVPEANTAEHAHLLDCDYDVLGSSVRVVLSDMPAWNPVMSLIGAFYFRRCGLAGLWFGQGVEAVQPSLAFVGEAVALGRTHGGHGSGLQEPPCPPENLLQAHTSPCDHLRATVAHELRTGGYSYPFWSLSRQNGAQMARKPFRTSGRRLFSPTWRGIGAQVRY